MIPESWEVAHIAIAVSNIEEAQAIYGGTLHNGQGPMIDIHHDWVAPLSPEGMKFAEGRAGWLLGSNPPIEILDGPEGSPWWMPEGQQRLHHVAYWAEDLDDQTAALVKSGFEVEYTMPPFDDGKMRGFAYLLHPNGMRVELQVATDKPAMAKWLGGGELHLDWGF